MVSAIYGASKRDYIRLEDRKAANTEGGTFTSGAWRTRDLNTEVSDSAGICSLASNQFTLQPGTYEIRASAPAYLVDESRLRLQNITDTATTLTGENAYHSSGAGYGGSRAFLTGRFTITAAKTFELQHRGTTTAATTGFGRADNFGTEIYSVVELWRI